MIRELFLEDLSLWSCIWQSTLFAVIGLVGSLLLRRRPARASQVLFLGMIAAVLVPAMSVGVKHFEWGLFAVEPGTLTPELLSEVPRGQYKPSLDVSEPEVDVRPIESRSVQTNSNSIKIPWHMIAFCGWMIATLILLGRLCVSIVNGVLLLRRAQSDVVAHVEQAADSARARLGITRKLRIRGSMDVCSPVIWCWSPIPILVVPDDIDDTIDWVGVISHELAHWRRWDHVSGLAAELVVCILPWNPLLWLAKKLMVRFSEQACDDWVVAGGAPWEDYAQSLLTFKPQKQAAFVPAVVHSRKGLAARVRRILQDSRVNPRTGVRWGLAASVLTVCFAAGVAFAQTRPVKADGPTQTQAMPTKSLHEAAAGGDIEQVKSLLSKSTDVNAKDYRGRTALHRAAGKGYVEVVKLLIDRGADVNAGDRTQETPLHNACRHTDNKKIVELLINKGADVNARNAKGETPVHWAAWYGDKETVGLLLSKGADVNASDAKGSIPLYWAMTGSAAGRKEVVELLIAKGAKVSTFHLAAYMADMEKLKKSLQEVMDINTQAAFGGTVLHAAACSGRKDIVEFLIGKGAAVDAKDAFDLTPLYYAASHNYEDIADLLLAKGADVNAKNEGGYTLLCHAVSDNSKDAIRLLISKGANVNVKVQANNGRTPLIYAILDADDDVVELLIDKGADVDVRTGVVFTPLFLAAIVHRSEDLINLLNAKGAVAASPIQLAAIAGDLDKVKASIEKGADVNAKDARGWTALQWASFLGYKDIVVFLIDKGADIHVKDKDGHTPLHFFTRQGDRDIVELLLAKGADINAKDNKGQTALSLATAQGHADIVELLRKHGAKEGTSAEADANDATAPKVPTPGGG